MTKQELIEQIEIAELELKLAKLKKESREIEQSDYIKLSQKDFTDLKRIQPSVPFKIDKVMYPSIPDGVPFWMIATW